jgi:AraC family transcriptional regulator of adaptative response / DNA-3-methyladenine glycosylase II
VAATVELAGRSARCRLESPRPLPPETAAEVHGQLLLLLGLAVDPRGFERRAAREPEVARLIDGRRGLSIPQTATPFDGFLWVIVGQQVSLPVAFSLRRRLYEHAGERLGEGLYAPPTPASIAGLEEAELRALGLSRRKAEYLSGVARSAVAGKLDPEGLAALSATELERRLGAVRGFGPWSVDYLRMRAYALVDCVPVGDAGLRRNLMRFCDLERRPDDGETRRLMAPFAPHRSLATFHLWALEENEP